MEAKDDTMALCCDVCRHIHEQGTKCPICGHTGKSRSYQCFKTFTAFEFTVQRFDCQGLDEAINGTEKALEHVNWGLWIVVKILRIKIFSTVATMQPYDLVSRHFVSFVGDGPMGVACWHPACEESRSQVAIIEYLGIVHANRRQGYAKRLLRIVVEDIETIYALEPTHPQALVAFVPHKSFAAVKLFQSVGFHVASQVELIKDSMLLRMEIAWGCCRPV